MDEDTTPHSMSLDEALEVIEALRDELEQLRKVCDVTDLVGLASRRTQCELQEDVRILEREVERLGNVLRMIADLPYDPVVLARKAIT